VKRWVAPVLAVVGFTAGLAGCHGGVHCGATITTDVTLTENLFDCPGDGLVIGADDVTINLNGFLIDGDGSQPPANFAAGSAGIRDQDHSGVTVIGGTIKEFDNGVSFLGTTGSAISDLVITDTANGIRLIVGGGHQVRRNDVVSGDNGGDAYVLLHSHGNRIESNRNQFNEFGSGLVLDTAHFNTVIGNSLTGNGDDNIALRNANLNRVERNDASNSNGSGIGLQGGEQNQLLNNLTDSEASGIALFKGRQNLLAGNDLGDGLLLAGSDRTQVQRNMGRAIEVRTDRNDGDPATDNDLSQNRVTGAPADGILVAAGSIRTAIAQNVASNAGDDGIQVDEPNAFVVENTAIGNAGFGIRAVPGVMDGGGNTARDNGGPTQCLNISCS
jgi:parallel beta-helix repeat protein